MRNICTSRRFLQVRHIVRTAQLEFMSGTAAEDDVPRLAFGAIILGHLYHVLAIVGVCNRRRILQLKVDAASHRNEIRFALDQQTGAGGRIKCDDIAIECGAAVL